MLAVAVHTPLHDGAVPLGSNRRINLAEAAVCYSDSPPPPPLPNPPPPATPVGAEQDPHIAFAGGGRADFRGHDGSYYAFLSAPGAQVNVKTEDATFKLHDARLVVDGSFITEVHVIAVVGGWKKKAFTSSFWGAALNEFNTGHGFVNGSCCYHGGFAMLVAHSRRCEEAVTRVKYSSATISLRGWQIAIRGNHVYGRVSGPTHRLDVSFAASSGAASRDAPHGLVGQSFLSEKRRSGKLDAYPASGRIATSAQAEGAIEGSAAMYEVASSHATRFAFSRFDAEPGLEPGEARSAPGAGIM